MKKVKVLKKPRKSKNANKIKQDLTNKPIVNKKPNPQNNFSKNYLNFYDDIKTINQIYDW